MTSAAWAIRRRMEIFGQFGAGKLLLGDREFRVLEAEPRRKAFPCVFVRVAGEAETERISVYIWDDRDGSFALVFAAAEEVEDYLVNFRGLRRICQRDGSAGGGRYLSLFYARDKR